MIAKEWRDARWKLAIALLFTLLLIPSLAPYGEIVRMAQNVTTELPDGTQIPESERLSTDPAKYAVQDMASLYTVGGVAVLLPLAALLGVGLVSGEVGNGTILLLLSKPVGRTRALLTRYIVCANVLLAAAIFGTLLLTVGAVARGYPLEQFSPVGAALSTVLMWLGMLFVLGVALLASVLFRNLVVSVATTLVALYVILSAFPQALLSIFYEYQARYTNVQPGMERPGAAETTIQNLDLTRYWADERMFTGEAFAAPSFMVCLAAAVVPLLLSLWVFNRKAY
jgi:ABC-2 type transport system permease protein